jgi:3-hydroxyacyl-CoA dehydrogenase/enoyl-CoA hydratase/3-hydroxybutyryl-CoA epimerase
MSTFTLHVADGIARVVIDLAGEKVNKFSAAVVAELGELVRTLQGMGDLRAVAFTSAKPGVFIAGADIRELQGISDRAEALAKAHAGQRLFQRIAELPMPTVAVIDGACMGGGLEFALSCTYRVVADEDKTALALPEVTLGIIPGWGGTQRLPRLIGPAAALEMILGGRPVNARKAIKLGLADACAARAFLADEVRSLIERILRPGGAQAVIARRPHGWRRRLLEGNPLGRLVLFRSAAAELQRKTRGLLPAPRAALEVVQGTIAHDLARGLEVEAERFADLAITPVCKALIDCFFANEAVRKEGAPAAKGGAEGTSEARALRTAVLGAGVMGGGIAWAFARQGLPVRLKDLAWDAVAKGMKTANDYNRQLVKLRKLTPAQSNLELLRIGGTLDYRGFAAIDVVVEAVVEDLGVKRKVLSELEGHIRDDCLVCTNTSSLSVGAMAEAMRHPQRLVGMHFFNPVNRMPLVEVVPGAQTSAQAVQEVAALVRRLGKTAVVVKDCPGFLVNRILLPYLNEAARCLEDGADLATIDKAIADFGMPMGPFTLSDEVGLDVGFKVASILASAYGERMRVADTLRIAYQELHLLGTKGGRGFYIHSDGRQLPNPQITERIAAMRAGRPAGSGGAMTPDDIRARCLLIMVNEAARCLEEQVVGKPAILDLAMIMGTGFPPQRGGLLHYANQLGSAQLADSLKGLAGRYGERFTPCQLIIDLARAGKPFPT